MPVSPKEVNQSVCRLLDFMRVEFEPEIVEVRVEATAKLASCFYNVQDKINRDGGTIYYGWAVWEHTHFIEAEHHAVWEDSNGNLVDVTPQKIRANSILFIPDNGNVFDGQMGKPNVRLNITTNKLVDDFITYAGTIDLLYGLATRIDDQNLSLPEPIVMAIQSLEQCKQNVYQFYMTGNKYKSKCFCGSVQSYEACHGVGVYGIQQELLTKAKALIQNSR